MTFFEELSWRGLVFDATAETAEAVKSPLVVYSGFDPTAKSLHIGNLVPLTQLRRAQLLGHTPIALAGGGTGMIGDPSGKSAERNLQSPDQIAENMVGIEKQLRGFLDFDAKSNPARLVDNAEWLNKVTMVEFLREIGKNFSVNVMMQKESVRRRLESEDGISYTEFTYSLMQAYDYLELFDRFGCTLQIGGSDQWGNITAGTDLIRRKRQGKAHAMVFPLLTTASGQKFGKTEAGSVWLDPELTSPYQFYQYWYNTDDRDVERYLKTFTFLAQERIAELVQASAGSPEKRIGQTELACEVTRVVHGDAGVASAERAAKVLFGGALDGLSAKDVAGIFADVPSYTIARGDMQSGKNVVDLVVDAGLFKSKGEARRMIESGGVYVNNERIGDAAHSVALTQAIDGELFVLRKGKKEYLVVRVS
ncbi:MAG: tyrosine--tRNA ligase [bacterium]|nr:tyrosine--tRNA ligase [bacterium]